MRFSFMLVALAAAGCFHAGGPEVCKPAVTSWASPAYECSALPPPPPPTPAEPAPAPAPPPAPPPPPKTEVTQDEIKLKEQVEFETDSAVLKDASTALLDEVVQVMKDHPEIELVRVGGHTDSQGARRHNQELSEARAASVAKYLETHGIAAERLASKGYGQDRPIADNATDAGRAQNRRVEIHILRRHGDSKDRDPDAR